MSTGHNGADSLWEYVHFAATNAVTIEPGFKVGQGSSMKISVTSSSGMLAKRGITPDKPSKTGKIGVTPDLQVKYDATAQAVAFSLVSESATKITVSVYDIKGARRMEKDFSKARGSAYSASLSVKDLSNGMYLVRVVAGGQKAQRQFVKW